jgi:hypothetical protein
MSLPADASIDKIVALFFRCGYGVMPFSTTHILADQNSPSALFGVLVVSHNATTVDKVRETLGAVLTENKIPYYSIIVAGSDANFLLSWTASNIISNENIGFTTKKPKIVSHLRLVPPVQEENTSEVKEEVSEETEEKPAEVITIKKPDGNPELN